MNRLLGLLVFCGMAFWTAPALAQCDPSCVTCSGPTAAECTACAAGRWLTGSPGSCLPCTSVNHCISALTCTDVTNSQTHLCCYKSKTAKLPAPVRAEVTDQLGPRQVEVKQSSLVCEPCSKSLLP